MLKAFPRHRLCSDKVAYHFVRGNSRGKAHYKEATMAQGTVKWFNSQKGFGFIQPDGGGADVFVHMSAVEAAGMRALNEGDKITFDITTERGKSAATNLKKAA